MNLLVDASEERIHTKRSLLQTIGIKGTERAVPVLKLSFREIVEGPNGEVLGFRGWGMGKININLVNFV